MTEGEIKLQHQWIDKYKRNKKTQQKISSHRATENKDTQIEDLKIDSKPFNTQTTQK